MSSSLRGVLAAIPTPIDAAGEPSPERFTALAKRLLADGCDGLNVLGTTGEATSFTVEQRQGLMSAAARSGLPLEQMMVGTGAASVGDAKHLTRHAAELGYAGALVLPPFYYKGVPADGVVRYLDALVEATASAPIPLYLYHFPALSGVPYTVALVERLLMTFGDRIAGLKDSSGDLAYARQVAELTAGFAVFPSNEACLMEAKSGAFAGCVSATANLNSDLCRRGYHAGDAAALHVAVRIRQLFDGRPLVPGVKAVLAELHGDPALAGVVPPLTRTGEDEAQLLGRRCSELRASLDAAAA